MENIITIAGNTAAVLFIFTVVYLIFRKKDLWDSDTYEETGFMHDLLIYTEYYTAALVILCILVIALKL